MNYRDFSDIWHTCERELAEHDKIIKHYHKKLDLGHPLLFLL